MSKLRELICKFCGAVDCKKMCPTGKRLKQSILATLIAEGWVRKDEVLARLPKIGQVDKKSIVLIFGRMFAKGYDAAIEECIAAITQTGGADEANHKS